MAIVVNRFAQFEALKHTVVSETTPLKAEGITARASASQAVEPLMSDFYCEVSNIKSKLHAFDSKIDQATATFEAYTREMRPSERSKLESQFNKLLSEARQCSRELNEAIKTVSQQFNSNLGKKDTNERIKMGIVGSLASRFSELVNKFQDRQRFFSDKIREDTTRRIRIVNPEATDQEIASFIDSGYGDPFGKALTNDARIKLQEIREQKVELDQLYRSVVELHELFVDMNTLVFQQGIMIDNIAVNIEQADVEVEEGVVKLREALVIKRSTRKKKIVIAIVSIVIVAAVAVPVILTVVGIIRT